MSIFTYSFSDSRCVTIHASHNITIENNAAYDHYGHCYFLEDGGEFGNEFTGNLGFGTRVGQLTPSDHASFFFYFF